MAYRKKLSRRKSQKMFTRGASRTHKRNIVKRVQRGGIRL